MPKERGAVSMPAFLIGCLVMSACLTSSRRTTPDGPRELVARAISQAGGRAALERARVLSWDGEATVHVGGRDVEIAGVWSILPPDSAVVSTYARAAGPSTTRHLVVAAPNGWTVSDGRFAPMSPSMLANERDEFYLYAVLRLVPLMGTSTTLETVSGRADGARGVRVRQPARPDVDLFFDEMGRVIRLETMVAHPMTGASAREVIRLDGELEAGGIRWPRQLRIELDGAPYFDLTMRNLRVHDRLDSPLVHGPR